MDGCEYTRLVLLSTDKPKELDGIWKRTSDNDGSAAVTALLQFIVMGVGKLCSDYRFLIKVIPVISLLLVCSLPCSEGDVREDFYDFGNWEGAGRVVFISECSAMTYNAAGNYMYNNMHANPSVYPFYWAIAARSYTG
jgi:hypothetical protein